MKAMEQFKLFEPSVSATALISAGGLYRYRLGRYWSDGPPCNFIMLNPSTADALEDDPTIRRCVGFARRWGYGSLEVTNLFALRSTDPGALRLATDPIGPENDGHLVEAAIEARNAGGIVVCAWGAGGPLRRRDATVIEMLGSRAIPVTALKVTKWGHPQHPLYLRGDCRPIPFPPPPRPA